MNGSELRQWRRNADLTLTDLEGITGVSKSTISRFEKGGNITATSYCKLSDAMTNVGGKAPSSKTRKIKYHLKQIEVLIESEE